MTARHRWTTVLVTVGVLCSSCGSSSDAEPTSSTGIPPVASTSATVATTVTTTSSSTTTTVPSLVVSDLVDVRTAVFRVATEGAFADPPDLQIAAAGTGVGFIIAEDGLAVTTGRAVIGAETIGVIIDDDVEPVPATLIAYDECANLALIDIDGDGFAHLELATESAPVGTTVYVPEVRENGNLVLRDGIVADEASGGTTSWASIEALVEHTADASADSGGAPLLTGDARVVGVSHIDDTLDRHLAVPPGHVQALRKTGTGPGIGINGVAVMNSAYNGTWVAQVVPGSSAAEVGIQPGDVITFIGEDEMAPGGGRAAYCKTVSDEAFDQKSPVAVFRTTPPQHYEGTLNSGEPMARKFILRRDLAYYLRSTDAAPYEFTAIAHGDESLMVDAPTAWTDVRQGNWVRGDEERNVGDFLAAAPDFEAWHEGWATPGIFVGYSPVLGQEFEADEFLDDHSFESCTYDGRFVPNDNPSTTFSVWYDCGDEDSVIVTILFGVEPSAPISMVQMILVDDRDLEALERAVKSVVIVKTG